MTALGQVGILGGTVATPHLQARRAMEKPLIFISHIKTEREIAIKLKELVTKAFIGVVDVFVSSDPDSLAMGARWLQEITVGLKGCVVEIVLASPKSVERPWINFEAGAGWVRDIPVIPICHSGMTPETLPPPLSSLQAALATDAEKLDNVISLLAKTVGCNCPKVDYSAFIAQVKAFEETSQQLGTANRAALTADVDGLSEHAVATLVAIAETSDGPGTQTDLSSVREKMNEAGYRDIAAHLGVAVLVRQGLAEARARLDRNDNEVPYVEVTMSGWAWLEEHTDRIEITLPAPDPTGIPF